MCAQVGQELGLRTYKKPIGYWDNEATLDREISAFVANSWIELPVDPFDDSTTKSPKSYFYNQAHPPPQHAA